MKIRPIKPCACPKCHGRINGTLTIGRDFSLDSIPRDTFVLIVCAECGAILRRTDDGALDLVRGEVPPWVRAQADRAQAQAKERVSKLRRHVRKRPARGAVRALEREARLHPTVEAMRIIVDEWRKRFPGDVPAFALPHRGLEVTSPLATIGPKLARNQTARKLVEVWCGLARCPELAAVGVVEPTVSMLRMCLDKERIQCESLSLTELGLGPRGGLN